MPGELSDNSAMIFTLTDLSEHFPVDRFNEGWQLFTQGRVIAPNIQRGGELVTAVIVQPDGQPSRVYVRASREQSGVSIHGECSCEKKKNCEHVAAVLLQALQDQQVLPADGEVRQSAIRSKATAELNGDVKNEATLARQELCYVVHLHDDDVLIETFVARRLPQGGHSIIRGYDPARAVNRTPARFIEPADLELLNSLDRLPRAPDSNIPRLDGTHSTPLLSSLLASGRCYLGDAEEGECLSPGAPRQLGFQWRMDEFGYQHADWKILPKADKLIPLSPPWYVDIKKAQCGPLQSDLAQGLVQELLNLPPVLPQQVDETQQQLQHSWPQSALPKLKHLQIETAPQLKPRPCLRLTTLKEPQWAGRNELFELACLSFNYGAIEITRHTPSTRIKEGRVVSVQRDLEMEQAALHRLRELGLEEDENWSRESGEDCFSPALDFLGDEAQAWLEFQLDAIPQLRREGWRISFDHFRYRLSEVGKWSCAVTRQDQQDWFNVGLGVEVEGQSIDLLPVLLEFLGNFPGGLPDPEDIVTEHFIIPFTDEQEEERLLRLPVAQVLPILEILLEMYDDDKSTDNSQLRFKRAQLTQLTDLDHADNDFQLHWLAEDDTQQLLQRLRHLDAIHRVSPSTGLQATLRPYQQQGLDWLQFLREYGLAGILADDMGLGKTVQTLAHLLLEKESGRADRPSLVIAPTSLMFNWRREAEHFTPQLKVLVLHGPARKALFPTIAEHDLVITTYPLLARDREVLLRHSFHLVILDEAQVIKNPRAQAGLVAREIKARHRLCLTGTPLENHLGELWSLFDFLLPGLLGDSKQFRRLFRIPIEKQGSQAASERLNRRIRPFLLRRSKQQVAPELPARTEIIQNVALEGEQRELYETVRLAMHRRVRAEIERQGLARSHLLVLDALLKLRQVCCHPALVKMDKAQSVKQSAKLETLMEMLPEMIEEGRRILLFSQFTTMLELIEQELKKRALRYVKLTGQTRDRETPVRQFQEGEVPLFLISLKAGGVGLNLTTADTVIHYDPWWNPAVEQQATDRAHRIGQRQKVFVYKLICEGTLEEKIQHMQQRKSALAEGLYRGGASSQPQWDENDLEALFAPLDRDETVI